MGHRLDDDFAIYPMVEEDEATGQVAGVYAAISDSMPFVPSLFKSLATCPPYLVLAWDQASHALATDEFSDAALALRWSVTDDGDAPGDEVDAALEEFVEPLSRMLLLAAGLLLAATGDLHGRSASSDPPPGDSVDPDAPVPSQWDAATPETFGEIRRSLDTPIINSLWRRLAERDLLDQAWARLSENVEGTRVPARELRGEALRAARSMTWPVVADPSAVKASGIADAVPAITAILDAYIKTLARVLALVRESTQQP